MLLKDHFSYLNQKMSLSEFLFIIFEDTSILTGKLSIK